MLKLMKNVKLMRVLKRVIDELKAAGFKKNCVHEFRCMYATAPSVLQYFSFSELLISGFLLGVFQDAPQEIVGLTRELAKKKIETPNEEDS
jgi:hypothetical protein